jgi:thioredoxin-like negative regulator of GroEL
MSLRSSFLALPLVFSACNTPRTPPAQKGIEWIEDDYALALATARTSGRPLVVDAWAPWCHTCLSMKSFVFPDRALAPLASRFVWAAIDTEKPGNAKLLAKLPVSVWPTIFVVDPEDESIAGRWVGSATVSQLRSFLSEGERAVRAGGPSLLAQADAAAVATDWRRAADLYAKVEPRPEVLVSQIEALWRAGDLDACVVLGKEAMSKTGPTQSAIDFASFAATCAEKKGDQELQRAAEARLSQVMAGADAEVAADDRGAAYQLLWDLREKLGDKAGARRAAEDLLRDLGAAAGTAPDARAASTFNWARATAFLYVGRGSEAIAMLEASEKALPDDYNPPHQLARVFKELRRPDDALAALGRALAKAYGPRKGGLLGLRGELLEEKGDLAAAADAYRAQIVFYESLPVEQRPAEERLVNSRDALTRVKKAQVRAAR